MIAALNLMGQTALSVQREHKLFQTSLKTLLAEHLDAADAYSVRAQRELQQSVHALRVEYSKRVTDSGLIADMVDEVIGLAQVDAKLTMNPETANTMREIATAAVDNTQTLIIDAMRMDESSMLQTQHRLQLQAALKSAMGIHPRIALNMVKGGAVAGLSFGRRDRSGAVWNTTVLTRNAVRGLLVSMYCEAFLLTLLCNGIEDASVVNDEGIVDTFGILGNGGLDYESVRDQYLHPNASRLVQR